MAQLRPDLPKFLPTNLGEYAERELLTRIQTEVSDAYAVFHGVCFSVGLASQEHHGEIDLVMVNQAGDILLIEVKSGDIAFDAQGRCFKSYAGQRKEVDRQLRLQYTGLRRRLEQEHLPVAVHQVLVLPDCRIGSTTVLWPRERIADADDMPRLGSFLCDAMGGSGLPRSDIRERVMAFLENRFSVAPDVSSHATAMRSLSVRLSEGLATWVPRMEVPSGVIRVQATAGSGKTQLALRLMQNAASQGHRMAYLCFNRPLADHLARLAPASAQVETFHEMAARITKGVDPSWVAGQEGAFAQAEQVCIETLAQRSPDLDLLVVDEMQDLQPEWVAALLGRLKAEGKAYLLEDSGQQLYGDREAFDIAQAAVVRCPDNYRSPAKIVELINLLELVEPPIQARGPWTGETPDPLTYDSPKALLRQTETAVGRCLERGFAMSDIAIVTLKGRNSSQLLQLDRLGEWSLKRATGAFDANSQEQWTVGDLLIETIRRFKGQAAPGLVLTECDFAELDPLTRRLLFVGLTRAQVHLEWVMSERAALTLSSQLGGAN